MLFHFFSTLSCKRWTICKRNKIVKRKDKFYQRRLKRTWLTMHGNREIQKLGDGLQVLAWHAGDSPCPRHHLHKWRKRKLGWAMKSLRKGKATWADVACAKLQIACPEFMLIDLKKSILNCYAFIFKKNLNCSYVLLLDIFSIITQFFFVEDAMKSPPVSV